MGAKPSLGGLARYLIRYVNEDIKSDIGRFRNQGYFATLDTYQIVKHLNEDILDPIELVYYFRHKIAIECRAYENTSKFRPLGALELKESERLKEFYSATDEMIAKSLHLIKPLLEKPIKDLESIMFKTPIK